MSKTYHLVGIGGVGMSALATALLREGHRVSGSDRNLNTPNIRFLQSLGVEVFPDDGSGVSSAIDELVISTAIEETNPVLLRAKEFRIPVVHRAVALARALSDRKLIAVVGTCGKSTVTAMLGHILIECGLDPFCVNGANVVGWEGAVHFGSGAYAIAEVDESDRSLVAFKPHGAIVTNASADHYSKEEMDEVFDAFIKDLPGPLVDGRRFEPSSLPDLPNLLGEHNRINAALAIRMATLLGIPEASALKAMGTFRGVERRLQSWGYSVYDDYAHNPEKLRAMLRSLQGVSGKGVLVIWRPHGYGPLKKMHEAIRAMLKETLRPQDEFVALPVYDAGGTADRSINSEVLRCRVLPTLRAAFAYATLNASRFGAIVTAGARDPNLSALARHIAEARGILAKLPDVPTAQTFAARAKGLIGRDSLAADDALLIPRCNAIHTFFMRLAIDAIFLDGENRPVKVVPNIPPFRPWIWGGLQARRVLEIAAAEEIR